MTTTTRAPERTYLPRHRQADEDRVPTRRWPAYVALAVILLAQTVLSARLINISIASGDESLYIYVGHQLIYELVHGGGSPYYETYLSGAPDIYPVLAAMADHVGGLVAVRLMSLAFMLTATGLLFATTRWMFGYLPAVIAAGLFAGLGITQGLGVLATYDAMSLMLMAAAAYCAVRASDWGPRGVPWLLLVPLALAASNAAKYASLLFDPVVLGLAALQMERYGWKRVLQRLAALTTATVLLLVLAAYLAGGAYIKGIIDTTFAVQTGIQPTYGVFRTLSPLAITTESWDLTGAVVCLGIVALLMVLATRSERRQVPLMGLLLMAGIIVTVENIRQHNDLALSKHDDFGIWFTCISAGYALGRFGLRESRALTSVTASVALLATVASGAHYYTARSGDLNFGAPRNLAAYAFLRPYLELPRGRFLLGGLTATQIIYTDQLNIPWFRYNDDLYIKYPIPGRGGDPHGIAPGLSCLKLKPGCMYLEGSAGYKAAIRAHWFDLISMIGNHGTAQDAAIVAAVKSTPGDVLLSMLGGAQTWIYKPDYVRTHLATSPGWMGLDG
jgi:hypothetical protein